MIRNAQSLWLPFTIMLLAISPGSVAAAEEVPTKPRALRPGDTIMMVAPSGDLDEKRLRLSVKRLEEFGFNVIVPGNLFRKYGYLAGSDQERADEINRAFADPQVDAIFPGTGGYGVTRMLDRIDWDLVAANPKMVIGFSDITALHMAIAAKTNLATFHSPNPLWGLGSEDNLTPFAARYFWRNILADENHDEQGFTYTQPDSLGPLVRYQPGKATGRLIGGNLSLVSILVGTPYDVPTEGRVLFLEDTNEAPYRIDRMLSQLKLAGKLDACAAVLLGQFTKAEADDPDDSLSLDQVFADYFGDAPYPVIANFPAGHTKQNATLPLGALAEIDADQLVVRILENPVAVP